MNSQVAEGVRLIDSLAISRALSVLNSARDFTVNDTLATADALLRVKDRVRASDDSNLRGVFVVLCLGTTEALRSAAEEGRGYGFLPGETGGRLLQRIKATTDQLTAAISYVRREHATENRPRTGRLIASLHAVHRRLLGRG